MITYSIANDVASGEINPGKLVSEIVAANCVEGFIDLSSSGDALNINCASVTNKSVLDSVIRDHVSVSLAEYKASKNITIDERTQAIIADGFSFDGKIFSLSINAQMNWMGLFALKDLFTWPMNVTTNDDQQYSLSLENLITFISIGSGVVANTIGTGRALKLQVNAAETKSAVDVIVDLR